MPKMSAHRAAYILRTDGYRHNPMDICNTIIFNQAIDRAIEALEKEEENERQTHGGSDQSDHA